MKRYILVIKPIEFQHYYKHSEIFNGVLNEYDTLESAKEIKKSLKNHISVEEMKIIDLATFENLKDYLTSGCGTEQETLAWECYHQLYDDLEDTCKNIIAHDEDDKYPEKWADIDWDGDGLEAYQNKMSDAIDAQGAILDPIYDVEY